MACQCYSAKINNILRRKCIRIFLPCMFCSKSREQLTSTQPLLKFVNEMHHKNERVRQKISINPQQFLMFYLFRTLTDKRCKCFSHCDDYNRSSFKSFSSKTMAKLFNWLGCKLFLLSQHTNWSLLMNPISGMSLLCWLKNNLPFIIVEQSLPDLRKSFPTIYNLFFLLLLSKKYNAYMS